MSRPLRITVADNEPEMREYLSQVLPWLGHEVVAIAENGRQLVDVCRVTHPDLIITDIRMDEMNGIEALEEIHKTDPIPAIIISGDYDPDEIIRHIDADLVVFLVKPVKTSELNETLGQF